MSKERKLKIRKKSSKSSVSKKHPVASKKKVSATDSEDGSLSFEKVWKMFQETRQSLRETERILKESGQETDRRLHETERILKESGMDVDRRFKETDKKMRQLQGLFTSQWGKLVEALLGKGCLAIFQQRGIQITETSPHRIATRGGETMEVDVLLVNGTEVVFIEVKTTAKVAHVKELLEDLKAFKKFFPVYKDCKVYGALAALKFDEQCDRHAASQGLFVVEPAGPGLVRIKNSTGFIPKGF